MPADDVNFFDQTTSPAPASEPPPPGGEDDYGENVVLLPRGKRSPPGWKADWQTAETGQPLPNLFNVMLTLRKHPRLLDIIRYDEMARSAIIVKQIPNTPADPSIPRMVRDADVLAIQEEMQLTGLRRVAKATVQDALVLRADQDRFHPVREYLNGLAWDGEKRITGWLGRYLGVEGNPYSDTIGRLFLIAMVARIMRPGCKADYMLILEGPQGALKSSACRVLAGEWFSDNLPDLSRGDAVRLSMHLRGKWLIEIAEMSSFNSAEAHTLKEFLTQTEERYTPKYGHHEVQEPRQCLFIGSTNEGTYLRDATGARRFWPVKVGEIDIEALARDRDQILAETVAAFREGEKWWPDREFEAQHIAPEQAARYEADAWQIAIEAWLSRNAKVQCTVNDVLLEAIGLSVGQFGTREQRRASSILTHMGWVQTRSMHGRYYQRPGQTSMGV